MNTGKKINPLTSWRELGIYRLSARINEIAKTIEVQRGWKEVTNKHGETVKVREYWI